MHPELLSHTGDVSEVQPLLTSPVASVPVLHTRHSPVVKHLRLPGFAGHVPCDDPSPFPAAPALIKRVGNIFYAHFTYHVYCIDKKN